MKIVDIECINTECTRFEVTEEVFLRKEDVIGHCELCGALLQALIGNPAGKVLGSRNPCPKK